MQFVLDASVTLDWLYEDEQRSQGRPVAQLMSDDAEALVPSIWWYEVRNGILVGLRRNRITDERARGFVDQLERAPIAIAGLPSERQVFGIADKHNLTFYDACYLELAARKRCPLATLDRALINAAKTEGIRLIGVP